MKSLAAMWAVLGVATVAAGNWNPIYVPNYSFENGNGTPVDGNWYTDAMLNNFPNGPPIYDSDNKLYGWVSRIPGMRFAGRYNPDDTYYAGTTDSTNPPPNLLSPAEGTNVAFFHWGIYPTEDRPTITSLAPVTTIESGKDYRLTVAIGHQEMYGMPAGAAIQLLADYVVVAETDSESGGVTLPDLGQWKDFQVTLSSQTIDSMSLLGQGLYIRIAAHSYYEEKTQLDMDNVRLEVIPEPATLSLFAIGGVPFLRRKKRGR